MQCWQCRFFEILTPYCENAVEIGLCDKAEESLRLTTVCGDEEACPLIEPHDPNKEV